MSSDFSGMGSYADKYPVNITPNLEDDSGNLDLSNVPAPLYWRCVTYIPRIEEKSRGGIHLPDRVREDSTHIALVGKIIAVGPAAFQSPNLHCTEENCPKIGDWVMISPHAGIRVQNVSGHHLRIIDDNHILAVVDDPNQFVQFVS